MGKKNTPVCPGCSRHCPLDHVRCKYGQRYIEKQQKAQEQAQTEEKTKPVRKWEKHVSREGLMWRLLWTGRRVRHALRKKTATEAQLLAALSAEERAQLHALLLKITDALE